MLNGVSCNTPITITDAKPLDIHAIALSLDGVVQYSISSDGVDKLPTGALFNMTSTKIKNPPTTVGAWWLGNNAGYYLQWENVTQKIKCPLWPTPTKEDIVLLGKLSQSNDCDASESGLVPFKLGDTIQLTTWYLYPSTIKDIDYNRN